MGAVPPPWTPQEAPPAKKSNTALLVFVIVVVAGMCLCIPVFAAVLLPVFSQARVAATNTQCLSNVKQLALGQIMYAADFDETMAKASTWCDDIAPFTREEAFICPVAKAPYSYAMDKSMSGKKAALVPSPETQVLIFEPISLLGKNMSGDPGKDLATPPRHNGSNMFAYLDGSARSVKMNR